MFSALRLSLTTASKSHTAFQREHIHKFYFFSNFHSLLCSYHLFYSFVGNKHPFSQQHTRQQEIMSESLCIQRSTHLTALTLQQASGRDAQAGTKMGGVDYKLSRVSCVQTDAEALPILGYTLQYMNACTQDGCTCLPLKF